MPGPAAARLRTQALLGPPGVAVSTTVPPPPAPEALRTVEPPPAFEGPARGPLTASPAEPLLPAELPSPVSESPLPEPGYDPLRPVERVPLRERLRERLPVWVQLRCGLEPRAVAAVAAVLVLAAGFAAQQFWSGRPEAVAAPEVVAGPPAAAPAPAPTGVVVDIAGKVRDPGLRRLPAGARVEDALAAAGGVRPGADTTGLNRARILVDGEQVLVGVPQPAPAPGTGPGTGSAGPPAPVSLSTATADQLDGLPGVGPVLAQHIVEFRTARGGFRSVEDLRQVTGIGERRFADLRPLVRP